MIRRGRARHAPPAGLVRGSESRNARAMDRLTPDQRGVLRGAAVALLLAAIIGVPFYQIVRPAWVGVPPADALGAQIAYALKWDILVLLWLAGCVRHVSSGRFNSPADIAGSAFGPPSSVIAIRRAVLQNSLEQTVLAVGAHLALAVVLRGDELVLVPTLVLLYLIGRIWFALGYSQGAPGRAGGMVLTAGPTFGALVLAGGLALCGR